LKFQVITELLTGDKTPGQVAKVYGVYPNTVNGASEQEEGVEVCIF
jgi:hypothetical protein